METNSFNKYKCPCCEYYTLDERAGNTFQTCPVCFWEDDGVQLDDPDYDGGANRLSLNQAKENFKNIGASDERLREFVRHPLDIELKP